MAREQNGTMENLKGRRLLVFLISSSLFPTLPSIGKTKMKNPYDEKRLLEQNKRVQRENNAPDEFPSFVREGLPYFFFLMLYLLWGINGRKILSFHFFEY